VHKIHQTESSTKEQSKTQNGLMRGSGDGRRPRNPVDNYDLNSMELEKKLSKISKD
jgi:hypothetical protein